MDQDLIEPHNRLVVCLKPFKVIKGVFLEKLTGGARGFRIDLIKADSVHTVYIQDFVELENYIFGMELMLSIYLLNGGKLERGSHFPEV